MTLNSIRNQFIVSLKSFNDLFDSLLGRWRNVSSTPTGETAFSPVWHSRLFNYLNRCDVFTPFDFVKFINDQIIQFFGGGLLHNSTFQISEKIQRKANQNFNPAQVAA